MPEALPAAAGADGELAEPLHRAIAHALDAQGISLLYSHQAEAIDLARAGKHVVSRRGRPRGSPSPTNPGTGTAPARADGHGALSLPTKALAQDQLPRLLRFADASTCRARTEHGHL